VEISGIQTADMTFQAQTLAKESAGAQVVSKTLAAMDQQKASLGQGPDQSQEFQKSVLNAAYGDTGSKINLVV
jgi:hypothetical protein